MSNLLKISFKHYDGDVSALTLTYSIDEEVLGEMVTYDIIPCGRHINVTNDDKYVKQRHQILILYS